MRRRKIKEGDVVEVWDMALGEWVRSRVAAEGQYLVVKRPVVRCTIDSEKSAWRAAASAPPEGDDTMTTLVEQLERAMNRADMACFEKHGSRRLCINSQFDGCDDLKEARALRQRAAWVRELMAGPRGALSIAQQLAGPIPGETAPAAPKEGTVKCAECRGRGWHVGDCHPREVCGLCCGTGTVACCRDAKSVETPTCYVWDCPEHGRAIEPVVRGATAGEAKPTGDAEKGGG